MTRDPQPLDARVEVRSALAVEDVSWSHMDQPSYVCPDHASERGSIDFGSHHLRKDNAASWGFRRIGSRANRKGAVPLTVFALKVVACSGEVRSTLI